MPVSVETTKTSCASNGKPPWGSDMKRRIIIGNVAALMAIAGVVGASQLEGEWGILEYLSRATADSAYVNTSGDTMTGTLAMTAFTVTSTTAVANLNADYLDGLHGSQYLASSTEVWVNVSGDTMTGALLFGSGGTSIDNAAGPLNLGTTATTSQGLAAGDSLVGGKLEVNLMTYLDGGLTGARTLSAATGNETAFSLTHTVNKSSSGNDYGLVVNQVDTLSPGTSYLFAGQRNGGDVFTVSNSGIISAREIRTWSGDATMTISGDNLGNNNLGSKITMAGGTLSQSTASVVAVSIVPIYNMGAATGAIDLRTNRTETAVGSGVQRCYSAQVAGVEQWGLDNQGNTVQLGCRSALFINSSSTLTRGELVEVDSATDGSVIRSPFDSSTDYTGSQRVLGVVYGAYASTATTCARGATCIICTEGKAQVLVDATATTRGYVCTSSTATAGRAGCYGVSLGGGGVGIGYATESSTGSALQWTILK
jgi:hypothetical protein